MFSVISLAILLDSNFYIGLIHPSDKYSKRSEELLLDLASGEFGLLYTTSLIIAEVTTLVSLRTLGNPVIMEDVEELLFGQDKLANILYMTEQEINESWKLFQQVNRNMNQKKGFMSFVDVNLIVIAKNRQISQVLSFDEHFENFLTRIY